MGEGPNAAALDAHGLIFAVGTPRQEIKLFSLQGSDRVPFSTFPLPAVGQFTDMQFSNDGKYILVSTSGPAHMLVDAFAVCGEVLPRVIVLMWKVLCIVASNIINTYGELSSFILYFSFITSPFVGYFSLPDGNKHPLMFRHCPPAGELAAELPRACERWRPPAQGHS